MCKCNPLISVIVPVYNVEKYLNQCVDSLLNQTYKNFEAVLVDDGSPDNCPAICDEYAKKDNRIKVIHKKNGGLSDARNEGIKNASGKYLVFLDSDDYYGDDKFLEKLSRMIIEYNSDVVIFPMICFNANTLEIIGSSYKFDQAPYNECSTKIQALEMMMKNNKFYCFSACSYAIDRAFVLKNDLFFVKGIVSEDIEWALRLLPLDFKLNVLSAPAAYSRRGREGSITATIGQKNIDDLFNTVTKYADTYKKSNSKNEIVLLNLLAYQYAIICGLLARIKDRAYVKKLIQKLKIYKWLLNYDLIPKVRKVKIAYKVLGISTTLRLLQFYIKVRGR